MDDLKLYRVRYADGHLGEERTWESVLYLIHSGRHWRRRGLDLMIPVRVEHADGGKTLKLSEREH